MLISKKQILIESTFAKASILMPIMIANLNGTKDREFKARLHNSKFYEFVAEEDQNSKFGCIVVSEFDKCHFIEYMTSYHKGFNIGEKMIMQYMNQFSKSLIPYEIIKKSSVYWLKYFIDREIITFEDLMGYLKSNIGIDRSDVKWSQLETEYKLFKKFLVQSFTLEKNSGSIHHIRNSQGIYSLNPNSTSEELNVAFQKCFKEYRAKKLSIKNLVNCEAS